MVTIRGVNQEEEMLTDFLGLSRNKKINGEKTLSLSVIPTANNAHAFPLVEEEGSILFDGEEYVIKSRDEKAVGKSIRKTVTGLHKFYVDMYNSRQREVRSGSMTFFAACQFLFEGTGYDFTMLDSFPAQTFENFGKDRRIALLQKMLERYKAEIEVIGNLVIFKEQIGSDTDFQFRYGFNIKTFDRQFNTKNLATYIEGTGANGIKATYTSPNYGRFGHIDAEDVEDERFTSEASLIAEMKSRIQDTPEFSITIDFEDLRTAGYPYIVPKEGDRVFVIYEPADDLILETRIMEIDEELDEDLIPIRTKVTLANYRKTFAGTMFDSVQKAMRGITTEDGIIKRDVLDDAVQRATEAITNSLTEVEYPIGGGIVLRNQEDPNLLVAMVSDGIGVSSDNGKTFSTAMTGEGIVADTITSGVLRAIIIEGVEIYGSLFESREDVDGYENYIRMTNNILQSHGRYTRTWAGVTETALINLGIRRGQLWISNEESGYNLYFTERGLSTSMYGAIDKFTSGTLEFHSQRFNENSRGVTLHSSYGAVALVSDFSTIVSRSYLTNNIESQQYSVYIRPYMDTRGGLNEFQFYVKENPSVADTDGALLFGNLTGGATHGSGIRFSKQSSNPTIYATNVNGDIGTGNFNGRDFYGVDFYGSLRAPASNAYVMVAYDGALRVTDKLGYNNGLPNFRDLEVAKIRAENIRTLHGENFYIGVSEYELRVTNNLFYNGGDTGYKNIRAAGFITASSEEYKEDITEWNYDALAVIMNEWQAYQYKFKGDAQNIYHRGSIVERKTPAEFIAGKGIDNYEMNTWGLRAIQQLGEELFAIKIKDGQELWFVIDGHEQRILDLEDKVHLLEERVRTIEAA